MFNVPHQVKLRVVDRYGNRQPNVKINITPISMTIPSGNWLASMFGLGSTVTPLVNVSTMNGTTASDGAAVFTMIGSISYDIQITNTALGINQKISLMPIENEYTVWVSTTATAVAPNCGSFINGSLYVYAPTTATTYLNFSWHDSTASITNVSYAVYYPNHTPVYSYSFDGPAPLNQSGNWSYAVTNTAGNAWVWEYSINSSTCGNLTGGQGITLKGATGKLVNLDPCGGYTKGWDSTC
jgi:hypothetical protein